jgi:hypothetical protein
VSTAFSVESACRASERARSAPAVCASRICASRAFQICQPVSANTEKNTVTMKPTVAVVTDSCLKRGLSAGPRACCTGFMPRQVPVASSSRNTARSRPPCLAAYKAASAAASIASRLRASDGTPAQTPTLTVR